MGSHVFNQDQSEVGFIALRRGRLLEYVHTGALWVLVATILLVMIAGGLVYLLMPRYDGASSTHTAEETCFMLGGVPRYSWFNQGFTGCDFPPAKGK
jgi:hypothetical protein